MGLGVGIFLIAVGAILAFAFNATSLAVDVHTVGWILLWVGLAIVLLASGIVLWYPPTFAAVWREVSWLLHDAAFLLFAVSIVGHIYLGTAALPGTFKSMTRGTVSKAYARQHHPRWYRETTGDK